MLLYKYRPWNIFTEDVIVNKRIYFPSKKNLNDPAELVHPIRFQEKLWDVEFDNARKLIDDSAFLTASKIYDKFRRLDVFLMDDPDLIEKGDLPYNYKKYAQIEDEFLRTQEATYDNLDVHNAILYYALAHFEDRMNLYYYYSEDDVISRINNKLERLGLLCLSKKSDCPVMWAHYAANHTGVILIFETEVDPLLSCAKPIKYVSVRPEIKVDTIIKVLYMKAKTWSYEKEFRVISKEGDICYEFEADSLKGIILGLHMKNEERSVVKSLAKKHNLDLYQAISHKSSYSILYEPIIVK